MLNKIIEFSINNKLIVGLLVVLLMAYGAYEVTRLPIDAVPDITDNQVQVITVAPALGAPDVERLITFPIEQSNSNIPGLKEIRSFSRFGLSVVTIVFNDNVDVYWARQQVNERLLQAQELIPKEFGIPKLAPVTTGLGEIYQYSVRPKKGYEGKYDAMQLRTIQDWIVRRQLIGVKGVAEVASFGGNLKQYEIAVDPAKLKANNVTMSEVFTALESNNQNTGGAYIERGPTVLFIRSEGLVGNREDIESIVIKNTGTGTPLLIRNIGEVRLGSAIRYGAMTYNGQQEVSGAVVMMLKGANSNEVIGNIKKRIEEIQKTLPEGVVIDPFLDRTKMVNNSIGTVSKNLLEGALIVIFVLVLFLGNFRAGLLVASVIPLAMLFAIIMMNLFGVSGNLMSLGALDFGLIVDGAVIIVEAVMHNLAHRRDMRQLVRLSGEQMDLEVKASASRMMNSALFGQVIILIVYLPIFTLKGIEGKMFLPMAQTVVFALLGAFLLSLTYIPMMSSVILSKKLHAEKNFSDRMMESTEKRYRVLLQKVLTFPKTIVATSAILLVCSVIILLQLGGEFIPTLPEGDFAIETRVLAGSSLNTSIEAGSKASKILLKQFPEVEKVVVKTGTSEIPTDPMPMDGSDIMVILKPRSEWTSASSYNELIEKMSGALEAIPGVTFGFQYPVAMRFNELMTGARQDVVCKIFGENLDTLAHYAKHLGDLAHSMQGVKDLYIEVVTGVPQIVIKYNRSAIAQYGLNINAVNRVVNTAFAGQSSGLVYEGERRFDLVVRMAGEQRRNLASVRDLLVPIPGGNQVPLSALAQVDIVDGPNQIQREDAQRRIIVGFNTRGKDVQTLVEELQQKVHQHLKLPSGYHITYGGAFENLEAAKNRLSIAVPVSLLLILAMLYFAFHSLRHGLLIYSAIPLSAIGGILALALRGMPFSISAGVGFIALFGVSVLNGIVLVAEFNRLKNEQMKNVMDAVLEGTRSRLRPVLMTALVASLGFLPMALSTGEGAEVQRPLATVVIGGLLVATFLTLFVLPSLYILFGTKKGGSSAKSVITAIVLVLLLTQTGRAQTPLTLQAAIDTAIKNNLSLKGERLNSEYLKKIKGTAAAIQQADVSFEYGQINSVYYDNRFNIQQNIHFPTVYTAQKNVYNEQWKTSMFELAVKEKDIRRQVTYAYYNIIFLQRKEKLLLYADSIFAAFLQTAELRFSKGETNVLEKTTAQSQRGQIEIQLKEVLNDLATGMLQLKYLLNINFDPVLATTDIHMTPPLITDTATVREHPLIKQLQQQERLNFARLKLEKTKLLPDLFASYSNMTIRGVGADEKIYTLSDRFHSFQVGLGIPLFAGAQSASIKAMRVNWQLSQNMYAQGLQSMRTQYGKAMLQYSKSKTTVAYYEATALPGAKTILSTADLQFKNGSINYLEWVLLANNALSIQSQYIDAVKELNQNIIELNYLNN